MRRTSSQCLTVVYLQILPGSRLVFGDVTCQLTDHTAEKEVAPVTTEEQRVPGTKSESVVFKVVHLLCECVWLLINVLNRSQRVSRPHRPTKSPMKSC